jgi:hypothetical protein
MDPGVAPPIRIYSAIGGSSYVLAAPATGTAQCGLTCARHPSLIRQRPPLPSRTVCCRLHAGPYRIAAAWRIAHVQLGWSRLETGPRYQQNCTECHKEKARPIRSESQESQAARWRLQSVARGPGGIPATQRSPPNSGACHVQDSADNEERAKSHQEHSRLSICRCPAQYNRTQASRFENVPAKRCNSAGRFVLRTAWATSSVRPAHLWCRLLGHFPDLPFAFNDVRWLG